jgi:hypothetical protein
MRFILSALRDIGTAQTARILDAGCGTGGLLQRLARRRSWGLDDVLQASVTELPFRQDTFDLALSINPRVWSRSTSIESAASRSTGTREGCGSLPQRVYSSSRPSSMRTGCFDIQVVYFLPIACSRQA